MCMSKLSSIKDNQISKYQDGNTQPLHTPKCDSLLVPSSHFFLTNLDSSDERHAEMRNLMTTRQRPIAEMFAQGKFSEGKIWGGGGGKQTQGARSYWPQIT